MRDPFRCRMPCDADPKKGPAIEPDNDEGIEQIEADRRDNEQIHRGDMWEMIAQKAAPSLARRAPPFDHVFGDAGLRNLKPELEQLAVNTRRAPQPVLD